MARKRNLNKVRESVGSRVFDVCNVIIMVGMMFVMLYPFWNQLVFSLNDGVDSQLGNLYFWPRVFTFANYTYVFENSSFFWALFWSLARTVVGTVSCLAFSGLIAYVASVKWFSFRRMLRFLFVMTMYIGGGMIPMFLWLTRIHLTETFHVYWLPGIISGYYLMVIMSYIYNFPDSITESARMDGAREFSIYVRIVVPMCIPVFAALGIMCAVGHWNAWFDVMIYNPSGRYDTLQMLLRDILLEVNKLNDLIYSGVAGEGQIKELAQRVTPVSMRAATTMLVTIPIVCVYPFFQKYFIKGISLGSVKG